MAADEIRPALTPEQWGALTALNEFGEGLYIYGGELSCGCGGENSGPLDPHASTAIANAALPDGDPRKITVEDVHHLRNAARMLRGAGTTDPHPEAQTLTASRAASLADYADRLADRIAALLPSPAP